VRIVSVVGARPQFVKLAPISAAMAGRAEHVIVHTGQHYDDLMSDAFFRDLGIPAPDVNLAIGSGRHGEQTGAMLAGLEPVFERFAPDWVLVYGDTNSTLAASIAAVKLHLPVAHLEAGLRSFNRRMPEEHNRVLTDHAADLLLAPTEVAMRHLRAEGLADRSVLVGDVMTDVLYKVRDEVIANRGPALEGLASGSYYVATIHRPDNTDHPERLASIVSALAGLERPVVLLAHPRLRSLAERHGIALTQGALLASEPLPYPELVAAVIGSAGVITDSGGLQKEAFLLRVPATTIRTETEWVETVELGWNVLANDVARIAEAVSRPAPVPTDAAPYGDGGAAKRVVDALLEGGTDSVGGR
jgi:UDP-N-acetylglucosamine 2-epimerase (non-hydrolysing)